MATASPSVRTAISTWRPSRRRILAVGAVAVAISAAVNGTVALVLGRLLTAPASFLPLQPAPVLSSTVVAVSAGVVLFAAMWRISADPIRTFTIVAGIAIPVSLAAPAGAYFANIYPGTTVTRILAVMVLHILAGLITIAVVRTVGSAGAARS